MTPRRTCPVPVDAVVARLRQRPDDLRTALGGKVLTVTVEVTGIGGSRHSIVFSPDGHVALRAAEDWPGWGDPHVHFRGPADQVLRVVMNEVDTFTAVMADNLRLSVPTAQLTPHYKLVMRLVREEIWNLLQS